MYFVIAKVIMLLSFRAHTFSLVTMLLDNLFFGACLFVYHPFFCAIMGIYSK